jgi:nitrile hydratase subunit beta
VNGVHDVGGMHGFGPIPREENEPVFHAEWERRMYGIARLLMNARLFNLDEYRHALERIPPPIYLGAKYYEKWAIGAVGLLLEKGILKPAELKGLKPITLSPTFSLAPKKAKGAHAPGSIFHQPSGSVKARFKPGDKIMVRIGNPPGHTRLPRYARGKRGTILFDEGVFPLPDNNAHGGEVVPQHVYAVRFAARDLWGEKASPHESVSIDLWEAYLEPLNGTRANGRNGRVRR